MEIVVCEWRARQNISPRQDCQWSVRNWIPTVEPPNILSAQPELVRVRANTRLSIML